MIGHGTAFLLHDRLMNSSDASKVILLLSYLAFADLI